MRKVRKPPALNEFDRWGSRISSKILAARKADAAGRARLLRESEWGATAFHVYGYVHQLEREQLFDELKQHLGRSSGPAPSESGLVLRLVNKARPRNELLSPSQRSRQAAALELARKLNIEPALILGFLCEIRSQKVVARMKPDSSKLVQFRSYQKNHLDNE